MAESRALSTLGGMLSETDLSVKRNDPDVKFVKKLLQTRISNQLFELVQEIALRKGYRQKDIEEMRMAAEEAETEMNSLDGEENEGSEAGGEDDEYAGTDEDDAEFEERVERAMKAPRKARGGGGESR